MSDIPSQAQIAAISEKLLQASTMLMVVPAPTVAPVAVVPRLRQPLAQSALVELRNEPTGPGLYHAPDGTTYMLPEAVVARRRKGRDWPAVYLERRDEQHWLQVVFDLLGPDGMPETPSLVGPDHQYFVQLNAPKTNWGVGFGPLVWRPAPEGSTGVIGQLVGQMPVDLNQMVDILQNDSGAHFLVSVALNYRHRHSDFQTINLLDYGPQSRWVGAQLVDEHNGTGDVWLTWNGNDGANGGVVVADTTLEDGQWRPAVLHTHPKWLDRGTIKGWLPWLTVPAGARFEAEVGFVQGASHTDGVTFWVWLHETSLGYERWHPVVQLHKRYNGRVEPIAVDLSAYAGQSISLELRVDAGPSSGQDWAAWFNPRIVAPGAAEDRYVMPQISINRARAFFPPNVRANRPIYQQVAGGGLDLDSDADWIQSPHGGFKETGVIGQFFVLPDAYGLAFDAARSQPAITVLLVPADPRAGEDSVDYVVRVRLSIVPELDARRLDQLRAWINGQNLDAPYAGLLIGGYEQARFTPSDLFADLGLTFRGGNMSERPVDPRGFELILDCSIEAYTLLTNLLINPPQEVPLGVVDLTIRPDGASTVTEQRSVNVWLRLHRPVGHPLTLEPLVPGAATVTVSNPSDVEVSAEARPVMLVADIMNGEIMQAIVAQPQPLTLPPRQRAPLALTPQHPGEAGTAWNTLALSLWGLRLGLDSQAVLSATHQLASRSNLRSKVRLWSYLLQNPAELQVHFPDVYGVEVQIRRGTGQPVTASLTVTQPDLTVPVGFSLIDLLDGMRPELPTFELRRRNQARAGAGPWTDWETITGREIQIAPVQD